MYSTIGVMPGAPGTDTMAGGAVGTPPRSTYACWSCLVYRAESLPTTPTLVESDRATSPAVCVLVGPPLSLKVSVAWRRPNPVRVKPTCTVHVPPAATVVPLQ